MKITNLHIYPSPFRYETRILKETRSIIKFNLVSQVIILSTGQKGLPEMEWIDKDIQVRRIKTISQTILSGSKVGKGLMYVEFYLRAIVFALGIKIHVINCHSLMVLPLSVILKTLKRCKLIYDPHELETERLGLKGISQTISKSLERWLIKHCNKVIVVSDSIRLWYEKAYRIKDVTVVRNIPNLTESNNENLLKRKFGIPTDDLLFIYQGLLNEGRSIDLYLNTFSKLSTRYHLVIMGYGALEENVKEHAKNYKNIHFQPAVEPHEIIRYTSSADIGLTLIENCCLSYYYCLPNKFFEYLMAELPVIVSDFPDMAQLVRSFEVGWPVEVNEEQLSNIIRSIDQQEIRNKRQNIKKMKRDFTWENEETAYIEVYQSL